MIQTNHCENRNVSPSELFDFALRELMSAEYPGAPKSEHSTPQEEETMRTTAAFPSTPTSLSISEILLICFLNIESSPGNQFAAPETLPICQISSDRHQSLNC
ncbi:hypothetical protein PtB15_10B554 [Puccinia triticina]|nr:hypothetical protein PtB15_10B554 [Puccinia triticina]